MTLPTDFTFTQASLQDYVECRRRFELRWLLALAWPAVDAEPVAAHESHVRDGEAFHRLIHQHQLGLAPELLAGVAAAGGEGARGQLTDWWTNYLAAGPADLPAQRYPEITLSAPLEGYRLLAKYDLVAIEPGGRAEIIDWKTNSRRPPRAVLSARLQTRVYRYVLAEAGAGLNGGSPIPPGHIAMRYWFANFADQPERLPYDTTQHAADRKYLSGLAAEIAQAGQDDFPLTGDARRCRFCPYRSLCGRGTSAGHMGEEDAEIEAEAEGGWAENFDFEQVAEVAF